MTEDIKKDDDISCVILCKDEGYELGKCLKDNKLAEIFGRENILVVDSSEGEILEVERMVCSDFGVKFIEKRIGGEIKGIGDLRNYSGLVSSSDWVLYIDVDELYSLEGLRRLEEIIKKDDFKYAAYRFPRINLPWYEGWPDYQTRLVNVGKCVWVGDVHESLGIIVNVDGIEIKGEFGILKEYPIIHKDRGMKIKGIRNKRWGGMGKRNVLICSLFKDSKWHMDKFLGCITKVHREGLNIELCFIEGNSTDNTWDELMKWKKEFEGLRLGIKCLIEKLDINEYGVGGRFDRLGLLRNMLIKMGLRGKHDYVLMVDSDVVFDEDLLLRLIESIEKTGSDVMGCMVMIENFRTFGNDYYYDTLAYVGSDGNKFVHYFPYSLGNIDKVSKRECLEMRSVGTCYLVKGDVYNLGDLSGFGVVKCYKEVERGKKIVIYDGRKKSEQIRWCDSVRDAGYKVMIDSGVKVLHVNLEKYGRKWH